MQKLLPKSKLKEFILGLTSSYNVIIPVKEGITKFKLIEKKEDLDKLFIKEVTLAPFKEFLIPEKEELINFKNRKLKEIVKKQDKTIVFGLRKCDLNAFLILDKIMFDENYKKRRNNLILIGLHCENPDEYCFCNSMELESEGIYDLFFYPEKNDYFISIGSDKGKKIVKKLKKADKEVVKEIKNKKTLANKDIEKNYNNKIWKSDADRCLSCGACTVYCPTCNCFDIKDEFDINLKDGKRFRETTSCQLQSFSRVAGGRTFRTSVLARFKHFVYHKIVYFKKQKGRYMCVGCGRCLRVCPPRIDWVNTINLLKDLEKPKKKPKLKPKIGKKTRGKK